MKVQTSITVDKDLLETIDRLSASYTNRSEFIEAALNAFIAHLKQIEQNKSDLQIINQFADDLNQEAMDVLDFQVAL